MNTKLLSLLGFSVFLLQASLPAAVDPTLPKCPPDWKVEVIAQKPLLRYPSVVCAAPDGRVFVAQDPMDMPAKGDVPTDSILCFFPDGRVTLFATNLYAVFGMAYLDGKLYVHQCPKLTVFTDDNGVGKEPADLFSTNPNPSNGGGLNDHIPANMRLAMDGYFYMAIGDKGVFAAVGKDGSKAELKGGGLLRFRPDGTQLEVYSSGTRNHLDVAINAEDEMFTYDNTDDGNGWWTRVTHMADRGFYGYPYDYKPQRGYTLWKMTDYGGGSPTGALAYNEDALPEEYRGNLFLCEWGRKQLLRLKVSREGGSYKIDSREDFLTAGTEEFRPVGVAISPDGLSIYLGDWNVSGWKKPDVAGRLLKVTYTGRSLAAPKPAWWLPAAMGRPFQATTDDLITGLKHPAQSVRLLAQRRLAERKADAVPKLVALLKDASAPAIARAHAIWTLDAIDGGTAGRKEIIAAVTDKNTTVRSQAIRELGTRRVRDAAKPLVAALADGDAAIRFRAATALGRIGDLATVPALTAVLDDKDFYTRYAVFTALNHIGRADYFAWPEIIKAVASANPAVREGALFALRETYDDACVKALGEFIASPKTAPDARAAALDVLAELHRQRPAWDGKWWATQPVKSPPPEKSVQWSGTANVIATVRGSLKDASPQVRRAAVLAVETTGDTASTGNLRDAFAKESDPAIQSAILHTLGALHDAAAGPLIAALFAAAPKNAAVLPDAIGAAGQIGGDAMVTALVKLMAGDATKNLSPLIVDALGATKSASAVAPLAGLLKSGDAQARPLANAALQRVGGPAVRDAMLPFLNDSDLELRRLTIATLGSLKDRKVFPELQQAYQNKDTREAAVLALAQSSDSALLDVFLDCLDDRSAPVRAAVYNAMKPLADRSLKAVEERHQKKPFNRGELGVLHRLYERNATARSGPLFEGVSKPAEPAAYVAFAEKHTGDVNRGKKFFADLNGVACIKCHRVGKEGGEVGPDLAGVGAKYNRAQLIEAVIYPSKLILDGYHQTRVMTRGDEEISGIVRQETADVVTMVDTEGKLHTIKKADIASRKESELSLMPEGLQLGLSLQDFADLSSYLESLREGQKK